MGNFFGKSKNEINESTDNILDEQEYYAYINKIPKDEFLCPKCFKIPTISNICYNKGIIKLNCEIHGELELTFKKFYKETSNSIFHNYNRKCDCQKEYDIGSKFFYSNEQHKYYCTKCFNELNKEKNLIDINDERINNYKKSTIKIEDEEKFKEPIIEQNQKLSKIYRFNQIILNTYKKCPNNYFHIQSVIKLGESIDNESNKLDCSYEEELISKIENNKNNNELKTFKNSYKINDEDERLILKERNLGDKEFKTISQIIFTNLKEIDLSHNNIKKIECLDNMILPYLKILDMSFNKIENIKPISELHCKNLKVINLQKNEIIDISPFLNSNFPKLLVLKIEENIIEEGKEPFKELQKKYNKKLSYKIFTEEDFKKKYKEDIKFEGMLDLHEIKKGDEMLKDLYLILSNHKDNKITELKLDNNNLCDVSILSVFPLPSLNYLDLSVNKIKNLDFLNEMEIPKIKGIYLDDNLFYDIRQLRYLVNKKEKENEKENEKKNEEKNEKKYNIKILSLKTDKLEKLFTKIQNANNEDKNIIKKHNQIIKTLEEFKSSKIEMDIINDLDEYTWIKLNKNIFQ